jgi:hypothetical protein
MPDELRAAEQMDKEVLTEIMNFGAECVKKGENAILLGVAIGAAIPILVWAEFAVFGELKKRREKKESEMVSVSED